MKLISKVCSGALLLAFSGSVFAGNPQRAGSAGGSELLINPWARSAGMGSANVASVQGLNATFLNIAGITSVESTTVGFSHTQWLEGAGISINSAALNQRVSSGGVLTGSITSVNFGELIRTNGANPDGGIGTVSPSTTIISVGYAQMFTKAIRGGVNLKLYNTQIVDLNVATALVDAGVQYVTGAEEEIKFGVTLRNVGPSAAFTGDGQSRRLPVPQGGFSQAFEEKSAEYEMPATLSLGGSYDFIFDQQRLTLSGAFQSNSFQKDQYTVGAEYAVKELIMVRGAYTFFNNGENGATTTVSSGVSAGISVDLPLGKESEKDVSMDYAFRSTNTFSGSHSLGLTFKL